MKFQYIEYGADSPKTTVAFGHEFTLNGDAVDVTNPHAVAKLSNNASFMTVDHDDDETDTDIVVEDKPKQKRSKAKSDV